MALKTIAPRLAQAPRQVATATSNATRIRGRALQRIRREHFQAEPLCVACEAEGRVSLATELDHIVALCNGGAESPGNRQGLCADHHAAKTQRDVASAQGRL